MLISAQRKKCQEEQIPAETSTLPTAAVIIITITLTDRNITKTATMLTTPTQAAMEAGIVTIILETTVQAGNFVRPTPGPATKQ